MIAINCVTRTPFVAAFVLGLVASGQVMAQTSLSKVETAAREHRLNVEIKPLPTILTALGQAQAGSLGLAAEAFVSPHYAAYIGGEYVDVRLSKDMVQRATDSYRNAIVPSKVLGYYIHPGVRYYTEPLASSWYAEGGVGYTARKEQYRYRDSFVKSQVQSILPNVGGGYRWLFDRFLVRLGASAVGNSLVSRSEVPVEDTAEAREGQKKVRDVNRVPVMAAVDLGLGYTF